MPEDFGPIVPPITSLVSTAAKGLAPMLPNDATQFLNGVGGYTVPSGGGGGGAYGTLIQSQTLGTAVASVTFTVPATFTHLLIVYYASSSASVVTSDVTMQFNGDTTNANYDDNFLVVPGLSQGGASPCSTEGARSGVITGTSASIGGNAMVTVEIPFYKVFNVKLVSSVSRVNQRASSAFSAYYQSISWRNTAVINQVALLCNAGNFISGSIFNLYGSL